MIIGRPARLLIALALAGGLAARATAATPVQPQAAPAGSARLKPLQHKLREHGAEVSRLQRQVSQQEERSRQAGERLRQQDQAIEALRRQLRVLHGASAAASAHP